MSDVVVSARGVGKRFRLGQTQGGYELLSERITGGLRNLGRRDPAKAAPELWALRDIDFEVRQGETFGIIGHNGAGKSTLLKVLSRVTPPTEGEVDLDGRVGSLLEVGTGFHPELTGRENIFLNGAVLGMRRHEIARRFDEIVEFAEVQRFIDTPVKRYSSGMYLRLAFAVAAHLEPEILVVDEVLSVGDLAFQEKCLGRMEEVSGEGRTVLFVSHNLAAVSTLCSRSMLLAGGQKITEGPTPEVISRYVETIRTGAVVELGDRLDRTGSGRLRFTHLRFEVAGTTVDSPTSGVDVDLVLGFASPDGAPVRGVSVAFSVSTALGQLMLHLQTRAAGVVVDELPPSGEIRCRLPRCPLPAGQYVLNVFADAGGEILDWVQRAADMTVIEGDFYGHGQPPAASHPAVLVDQQWDVRDVHGTAVGTRTTSIGSAP